MLLFRERGDVRSPRGVWFDRKVPDRGKGAGDQLEKKGKPFDPQKTVLGKIKTAAGQEKNAPSGVLGGPHGWGLGGKKHNIHACRKCFSLGGGKGAFTTKKSAHTKGFRACDKCTNLKKKSPSPKCVLWKKGPATFEGTSQALGKKKNL